jgi:hypothetical protein
MCRVSSKWKIKFFGSNRNKPKQDLFRVCFGLFRETKKKNFGLFRCFEPISKQPKQTELFRNEPKQSGMFWKINHIFTRVLCLSYSCHIPLFLSSCQSCRTLNYSWCFSDQTDQGDETESFEREGLEMERQEMGRLKREGVIRLIIV